MNAANQRAQSPIGDSAAHPSAGLEARLSAFFNEHHSHFSAPAQLAWCLRMMVDAGLDQLPAPGSGATLRRWQALAHVASQDLSLCKLYEGHTDALAIIAELGVIELVAPGTTWGMWAAEPPSAKVRITARTAGNNVALEGIKAWCSGATVISHALMTVWDENDQQQLVAVDLRQAGVHVTEQGWHAVGMSATASVQVRFSQASAICVGAPDAYLQRPGFWQGGGGIAACWYGAARSLAQRLKAHCLAHPEPHALAHLGAVDSALRSAAAVLRECAMQIDLAPHEDAQLLARRARAVVENSVEQVLTHVGRALGAGPYCLDEHFARLAADLPVFIRQSHAERDLAALGQLIANLPDHPDSSWPV